MSANKWFSLVMLVLDTLLALANFALQDYLFFTLFAILGCFQAIRANNAFFPEPAKTEPTQES